MTYEEIIAMGLQMPEVEESLFYRQVSLKRGKRWMLSLKEDGETIAIKLDWPTHDRLLQAYPDLIFKTDHFERYPGFLVRLNGLEDDLARELLQASWKDAPLPATRRKREEFGPARSLDWGGDP